LGNAVQTGYRQPGAFSRSPYSQLPQGGPPSLNGAASSGGGSGHDGGHAVQFQAAGVAQPYAAMNQSQMPQAPPLLQGSHPQISLAHMLSAFNVQAQPVLSVAFPAFSIASPQPLSSGNPGSSQQWLPSQPSWHAASPQTAGSALHTGFESNLPLRRIYHFRRQQFFCHCTVHRNCLLLTKDLLVLLS
jgi:hypothetical protein